MFSRKCLSELYQTCQKLGSESGFVFRPGSEKAGKFKLVSK